MRFSLLSLPDANPESCSWSELGSCKAGSCGNLWQLVTTCGNLWQIVATFGNFWQFLATFGNFWQFLTIFGNLWQFLTFSLKNQSLKEWKWNWFLHRPSRRRREGQLSRRRCEGQRILNPYRICPTILPLANLYIFKLPLNPFLLFNLILKSGAVLHLHLGWFYFIYLSIYWLSYMCVYIYRDYQSKHCWLGICTWEAETKALSKLLQKSFPR